MQLLNRRRFERFSLKPMYTPIVVRGLDDAAMEYQGHAYDISEGGVRFELDEGIPPGTPVVLEITLPGGDLSSSDRCVLVYANVVWVDEDQDEPGPVRMAAAFTRFARASDRERLVRQLASGRYSRAA